MQYLVLSAATLSFADGTQIELQPGICSFPKKVTEHWAFLSHARPISEDELKQTNTDVSVTSLEAEIEALTTENATLKSQLVERDAAIQELKALIKAKPNKDDKKQETGNGKEQSSTDS
ncbi:STY1053 family phage-associated protein [Xenorhabdus stockiae]|uniref:STY1053 family phage-associated protein n=1 Tax=Xenorhabdus stockiae TaxID=351614 RepID=UPI003CF99AC2